jgi:hypothetical protein
VSLETLLAEFDGSVCPACHHRDHDPGSCEECPRCELHTDEALAFVLRGLTGDTDDLMQRLATEGDPRFADTAGRAYIRIRTLQAALAATQTPRSGND